MLGVFDNKTGGPSGASYSGFGSKKEEDTYDQVLFNTLKLLAMRLSRFYIDIKEGVKMNADTIQRDDQRLLDAIKKHYRKLSSMENKKYTQPLFSQALTDFTTKLGLTDGKGIEFKDDLSRDPAGTSEDDNNSDFSGFTKFSNTNRPSGFFGKGKNSYSAQRPKKDSKEHG